MNATFRRDYLYQFNTSELIGTNSGDELRYLRYDRLNKRYVFIEGRNKTLNEKKVYISHGRMPNVLSSIKRLHCIGYEPTDSYLAEFKKARKLTRRLEIGDRVTNKNQLELGRTYRCTRGGGMWISEDNLKLIELTSNHAVMDLIGRYVDQHLPYIWLNNMNFKCELVD